MLSQQVLKMAKCSDFSLPYALGVLAEDSAGARSSLPGCSPAFPEDTPLSIGSGEHTVQLPSVVPASTCFSYSLNEIPDA